VTQPRYAGGAKTAKIAPRCAGKEVWEGLAVLDKAFVPHYRSPGHPETTAAGLVAEKYRAEGVPHIALQDGQALLIRGASTAIV
jgi:dipeptidase E